MIDYKGKIIVIKTLHQAKKKKTDAELAKKEVDIEILNLSAEDVETQINRRFSAVYRIGKFQE